MSETSETKDNESGRIKVLPDACFRCLSSTEKVLAHRDVREIAYPARHWFDIAMAENEAVGNLVRKIKPRCVLDIGCGTGRLIAKSLEAGTQIEKLVGIEGDDRIAEHARRRFEEDSRVSIVTFFVKDRLPLRDDDRFDLCMNSMNIVGWQENERTWLALMLRHSDCVFFTVYKKGFESEREEMYKTRGHSELGRTGRGDVILKGCSVCPEVVSKAYTRDEIEELCRSLGVDYTIFEVSALMLGCILGDSGKSELKRYLV